jgi:filamentous hemagglutinin
MTPLERCALVLATALYVAAPAVPAADLPVPCAGGTCAGIPAFVTDGAATAVVNAPGTRLDVNQASDRVVLNWAEFNVAAGNTVNFNQPGANSLAVNRIFQGDPSRIFGTVSANGQIYLINQNGILFGRGSQVNVGGLIASSLDLDPDALSGGILNPQLLTLGKAAFVGDGRTVVLDQNGQVVTDANGDPITVKVAVEEGAKLTSNPKGGGRLALLGQQVENAGTLESPSGQVILAAGQKVYLQASEDPELRGLLVEVDTGGTAWNRATGVIDSKLGNVTLVGLAVNQDGRASATTSVQTNGSVRLLARDTVTVTRPTNTTFALLTEKAGAVSVGSGSVTEVLPDQATLATTAVDEQVQLPSRVEVVGREVQFRSGSVVRVPGGEVSVAARPNPSVTRPSGTSPLPEDPGSRIRIESGAVIDVSGSVADVDITRNVVRVELRSNELKDSPLQRDGALRGQSVFVDVREGTPLADVSGAIATIGRDVNERTGAGGTISMVSQGDVVVAEGATVDVSGGAIDYRGGVIATSKLRTPDGRLVDIGRADPDKLYTDVLNPTEKKVYAKWGVIEERPRAGFGAFEAGYREGLDAGTLQVAASRVVLNGTLRGGVESGVRQRTPATRATGGRLVIGDATGQGLALPDFRAPSVRFTDTPVPVAVLPGEPVPESWTRLELPTDYLTRGGFTRTEVYSNGVIDFADATPLALAPDSSLLLRAAAIDFGRTLRLPGGVIDAEAVTVNPALPGSGARRPGLTVAAATVLDVSGTWVNDNPTVAGAAPVDPVVTDGGRITLAVDAIGGELDLGAGTVLRADGGAWLDARGRLTTGAGGDLAVLATGPDVALTTRGALDLSAWGVQGSAGGTLAVGANRLRVAADGPAQGAAQTSDPLVDDTPYVLRPEFFGAGSFARVSLVASGGRGASGAEPLTIAGGVTLAPRQQRLGLVGGFDRLRSGLDRDSVFAPFLPPADVREAASLAFAYAPHALVTPATAGDLLLADGARIDLDPGGSVDFQAPTRIRLDGAIRAPSGRLTAGLTAPGGTLEQGFDPGVGIFVGSTARLDLRGTLVATPNDLGLRTGTVRDGGRVQLRADRGRVELAAGGEIDVSGAAATLDLPAAGGVSGGATVAPRLVGSRGGRVELLAPEGLVVDATLRGAGGAAGVEGGELALGVSRQRGFVVDPELLPTFPATPREIVVGTAVAPANGVGAVDPAAVAAGGFDSLRLQADDAIRFTGATNLAVRNRLVLEAPNLEAPASGAVALAANYVALGPQVRGGRAAGAAAAGPASLRVDAGLIDLFGGVALRGFGTSVLQAQADLRASGLPNSGGTAVTGSLAAAGTLTLRAAQVFPTTFSDFSINLAAAGPGTGVLRIESSGATPGAVLSAGGRLRLTADRIEQAGVLRAPLGELELAAAGQLRLEAGSVTSTAAVGQVLPFGRVLAGTTWVYEAVPGIPAPVARPRAARIALTADDVGVAPGATVDLRGGGDVYAYEFLPGPGGSTDALAVGQNPNLFAVLPGAGAPFGAFDTQEYQGSALQPGDSVRIDGVPGLLPAGEYALLPARYALLPGAVLLEVRPDVRDVVPGEVRQLADGARVVAGVRTVVGTGLADSRTTGFAVRPGSFGRELAEYRDSFGNDFFPARAAAADAVAPRVARDAGALQVAVGTRLDLAGELRVDPDRGDPASAADDGRPGLVDLSAERLRIVAAAGSAPAGIVEVEAATIGRIGSGSVLLGGTRAVTDTAVVVTPTARTVEVADGVDVAANELLLVGREQVTVGAGATVRADGAATGAAGGTLRLTGTTGGAVVRVARDGQVDLERAAGASATGDLLIGAGARLAAPGAVLADAAGTARSFGGYEVGSGALGFGSGRVVLGADAADVPDGLALDAAKLAGFGTVGELRVRAGRELAVAGDVSLGAGASRPGRLVLDTPRFTGGGGSADLRATTVVVRNTSGNSAPAPVGGTGDLGLTADRVEFAGGNVAVGGFEAFRVGAARAVTGSGDTTLRSAADLDVTTPLLAGAPGSELTLLAPGRAVTLARPATAGAAVEPGVGAALAIDAGSIRADTSLVYPAGRVRLAADGDVALDSGAAIDVAGRRLALAGVPVDVPGGAVELVARGGDAVLASGSRVDVGTGPGAAGAGSLRVFAGGAARFDGELAGGAASAGTSGDFAVTAAGIDSLDALAARLVAGGFRRGIGIETTGGDLVLGAGATLTATAVTVAASGGGLDVAGRIDASGTARGGRVTLAARDDLTLAAGSEIDARATGAGPGGEVTLASGSGDLRLAAGSRVRLDGAGAGSGGELLLRLAADEATGDARLAALDGTLEGAARAILEPVVTRAIDGLLDAGTVDGFRADLDAYMAAAPATIRGRLGPAADALLVRPGLELVADGDVAVVDPWNLATWRWDAQPGYLTVRAGGSVAIDANLSDGFVQSGQVLNQLAGDSWTYRIAAGADRASALPLAVAGRALAAGDATLQVGDGVLVRTGTGDIRLAAAGDIALAGATTAIYTAGVAARPPNTFGGVRGNWVRDGGDIELTASRDILAVLPAQLNSGWNVRVSPTGPAQWAIDLGRFAQGIAALAGGRVSLSAGRDIANVAATVATTSGEDPASPGTFPVWGGGDVLAEAGRDVLGGIWSTWLGNTRVAAGRDIGEGVTADFLPIAPTLASGNGAVSLVARRDLAVGTFVNPTMVPPTNVGQVALRTFFYNYSPTDAVALTAVGGELGIRNDLDALDGVLPGASGQPGFGVAPPSLLARAPSGDIVLGRTLPLLPGPRAQLALLAGGSVRGSGLDLQMSDASPAALPGPATPTTAAPAGDAPFLPTGRAAIHVGDPDPALIVAAAGDVVGGAYDIAKHFRVIAGRDVRDVLVVGQNTDARQTSLVRAGRDLRLGSSTRDTGDGIQLGGPGRLQVLAGRNVELGFSRGIVTVGRTVTPQLPSGEGAAIDLWAGLGGEPDYAAFNTRYWQDQYAAELARYTAGDGDFPGLIDYVAGVTGRTDVTVDNVWAAWAGLEGADQQAYLARLAPQDQVTFASFVELVDVLLDYTGTIAGRDDLTASTAVAEYLGFGVEDQRPLVEEFFFRELRDSGREANISTRFGFTRGTTAVDTLFPEAVSFGGDLSLLFSRIYTLAGGDMNLLVPGGLLNVGLAVPPDALGIARDPDELGIVAQGTGRIRVFTQGDVLVNQSRVFTLQGGDIVIWSDEGNIDAGRGSKSAISAPPPVVRVDASGNVTVEFADAIAGSGIRGILTDDSIEPGDVDLVAPTGEVNAGDAGIGSAGNINIAAPIVVGVDNIQVGGVSTGVPTDTGGLAAGLSGVSGLSNAVAQGAQDSASGPGSGEGGGSLADAALALLDVLIEGYGDGRKADDDCDPRDPDCGR